MDDLLQQGITAFKAGKRDEARKIFMAVVRQSPNNEHAWGGMYEVSNDDKERIYCLKQMLRINPKNEKANLILNQLTNSQPPIQSPTTSIPTKNIQNQDLSLRKCPYCAEMIQVTAIVCPYCGRDSRTGLVNVASNLPPASGVSSQIPSAADIPAKKQNNTCITIAGAFVIIIILIALAASILSGSTHKIRYEITGNGQSATITWINSQGGMEQGDYLLPFTKNFTFDQGKFTSLVAVNIDGSGILTCKIYVDDVEWRESTSSGAYSFVSCSGLIGEK